MQDREEEQPQKEPIDMTSDELLEHALAPELADQVKRLAKSDEPESEEDC